MKIIFRFSLFLIVLGLFSIQSTALAEIRRANTHLLLFQLDTESGILTVRRRHDDKVTTLVANPFDRIYKVNNRIYIMNRDGHMFLAAQDFEFAKTSLIEHARNLGAGALAGLAGFLSIGTTLESAGLATVVSAHLYNRTEKNRYFGLYLLQVTHIKKADGTQLPIKKIEVRDNGEKTDIEFVTSERTYLASELFKPQCDVELAGPVPAADKK